MHAAHFAMLDITDDARMIMDDGQNLGAAHEAPTRSKIEAEFFEQAAQGINFAARIGRQPNIGHAAAVDQFMKIKTAKGLRLGNSSLGLFCCIEHLFLFSME